MIRPGRIVALNRKEPGLGKPKIFNFPGFAVICGEKFSGEFHGKPTVIVCARS
jgi:hypothetical protein